MTDERKASNSPAKPFRHRMLQEIYEQPEAIERTIARHLVNGALFPTELDSLGNSLGSVQKLIIAASGSSRHAGLAGEIIIEDLSGLAVDVEYSSEYANRQTHAGGDALVMVITQSGETADTIAAQREARTREARTVAMSNVADSTIARESDTSLLTEAGPELAVPATKSFTAQLTVLYLFALFVAGKRGRMTPDAIRSHLARLREVPEAVRRSLASWDSTALECAQRFQHAQSFLYLGRGVHYAIAREGALKLKEISYVHAEGYPAGELRHGPNALVDERLPVVVLAASDPSDAGSVLRYKKSLAVLESIKSQGGRVIAVATEANRDVQALAESTIHIPAAPELLLPILEVVPLQLFAYHFGVLNGCDVDHPRNLVKSVVTE